VVANFKISALVLFLSLTGIKDLEAQFAVNPGIQRTTPGLHISARIGVGYYGGDLDAVNVETETTRRSLALDLLWHVTPRIGLVASVQQANYARIVDPHDLTSTSFMLRFVPFHGRISPYFQGGFHRTYGGVKTGTGPSGGLGISLAITPKIYFFQEVNANFVGPDLAIDNAEGGSGFDILGFLGGGIRIANIGVKYHRRAKIERLNYPTEIRSNVPVELSATIDKNASKPIVVTWDFGDGTVEKGNPIVHSFPHAGVFNVKVFAENAAGTDIKESEITVLHGMDKPYIASNDNQNNSARFVPDNANPQQAYAMALESVEQAEIALANAKKALAVTRSSLGISEEENIASTGSDQEGLEEEESEVVVAELLGENNETAVEVAEETVEKEVEETTEVAKTLNEQLKERQAQEEAAAKAAEEIVEEGGVGITEVVGETTETEATVEEATSEEAEPTLEEQMVENKEYFIRHDGGWAIVVASKTKFSEARDVMANYLEEGYNCEIMPAKSGDKTVYRVTVGQYENRPEANRMRGEFFNYGIPADSWLYEFSRSEFSNLWSPDDN